MFQFPGFAHRCTPVWRDRSRRVSPFGHPRVTGHLPLTAAFRSLSRPSSPPRATGIPHAPLLSFLDVFRLLFRPCLAPHARPLPHNLSGGGATRGAAFARLLCNSTILASISRPFPLPCGKPPHGIGKHRFSSLYVPSMSMTSCSFFLRSPRQT